MCRLVSLAMLLLLAGMCFAQCAPLYAIMPRHTFDFIEVFSGKTQARRPDNLPPFFPIITGDILDITVRQPVPQRDFEKYVMYGPYEVSLDGLVSLNPIPKMGLVSVNPISESVTTQHLVADIPVAGRTAAQVAQLLTQRLEEYLQSPNLTVTVINHGPSDPFSFFEPRDLIFPPAPELCRSQQPLPLWPFTIVRNGLPASWEFSR